MDLATYLRAIFALLFVIGLIGISAVIYRRCVLDKNIMKGGAKRRLSIVENLYLDSKRRLVLVKKDDIEFMILIGLNGETVINGKNIIASPQKSSRPLRIKSVLKRKKT